VGTVPAAPASQANDVHAGNADLAYAGNAASRYGHLANEGNADLAHAGAAEPGRPAPAGPSAAFTYSPVNPSTNSDVTFDGSASRPGAAPVTAWNWAFKNGQVTRSGPVVSWRLPSGSGTYDCVLTVTDSAGLKDSETQYITI